MLKRTGNILAYFNISYEVSIFQRSSHCMQWAIPASDWLFSLQNIRAVPHFEKMYQLAVSTARDLPLGITDLAGLGL